MDRLQQQLTFVIELDKLKTIFRQSLLMDRSRRENSAEHSWHLASMAMLLNEYAIAPVDVTRVMKMLLVHDIVEIDAGDTFAYDTINVATQNEREQAAAERLFGLLPAEQRDDLRSLWNEFEHRATPESKYANALDRLQPLLQNFYSGGESWRKHGVSRAQVLERMEAVRIGMPQVWPTVMRLIDDACAAGMVRA
ncbi:MAG TPA: HD domain-containing protein [Terriglobales bacterium]|nr:HD domain-containing protein [Terriglobales bacterium]